MRCVLKYDLLKRYVKYFDTETGALMRGMPDMLSPSILSAAA